MTFQMTRFVRAGSAALICAGAASAQPAGERPENLGE